MRLRFRIVSRAVVVAAALAAAFGAALAADEQPLAGHWEGAIDLPGTKLEVQVDLAAKDGALAGTISIPLQGARNVPLGDFKTEQGTTSFAIQGIPGAPTFKGRLQSDRATFSGDFSQGGQVFPFALLRRDDPAALAQSKLAGYDAWAEKVLADFDTPGAAVAVVKSGKVVLVKGFGKRDVAKGLPADENTLFAIGSATKAFTTLVLGTLADEGKLDWDKPLQEYIPEFRLADPEIGRRLTPRDLVTHRSGLPRHDLVWYNNLALTRAEAVRRLRFLEASKDLRETFQYNNLMLLTAGYLGERLTGASWEKNVQDRIFAPLGMTASRLTVDDALKSNDVSRPYERRKDATTEVPYRHEGLAMGPAGAIYSSAADMARWAIFQLGDGSAADGTRLVQGTTLVAMHTPQMALAFPPNPKRPEIGPRAYGMGWFVDSYRGHLRVQHGGNIDGFSTLVALFPQDDVGVVALVNHGASPLPDLFVREAFDRVAGLEPRDWAKQTLAEYKQALAIGKEGEKKRETIRRAGTKPAHPLEEYAGTYSNPGYGPLTVALADGKLVGSYNDLPLPLEHWHYETFNTTEDPKDPTLAAMELNFRTNEEGDVDALTANFESSVAPIVFDRLPDARMTDPKFLARLAGDYVLPDVPLKIALRGAVLTMIVPGQTPYELVPGRGLSFAMKGLTGYSVRFVLDKDGAPTELTVIQPEAVFTAKRK